MSIAAAQGLVVYPANSGRKECGDFERDALAVAPARPSHGKGRRRRGDEQRQKSIVHRPSY